MGQISFVESSLYAARDITEVGVKRVERKLRCEAVRCGEQLERSIEMEVERLKCEAAVLRNDATVI
jgi:hypothetical protein